MRSFKRGNSIFGVHINSITGKDKQTKPLGPNPFDYLGVTYSATGLTTTLHQVIKREWEEYDELDGSASYRTDAVPEKYRNKGFRFARWYPVYDWALDEGYENFSKWAD